MYATVGLLVVLHYGNHDPGQGYPGAIEGVDKLGLGIGGGAVADIGSPCLEVAAVGAGAYFQPLIAAGSPHLNVIRLGGGKA